MPFPKTEQEFADQGYRFKERSVCRYEGCSAEIEWWETPNGRMMPLDPGTLEPHWATCESPQNTRRRRLKNEG